jgi:hypothetical protein
MFDAAQLDALQSVINEHSPQWSQSLQVAEEEDAPAIVVGRDGCLYRALHEVAPPRFGVGMAVLTGSQDGISFYMTHGQGTLPPSNNRLSIEVHGLTTIEARGTCQWARSIFDALVTRLPVRYANVHLDAEYRNKNMVEDETGCRAIGSQIQNGLPGLYWLNYFGPQYVDLVGRECLLSAPAHEVKAAGDGVILMLDESAEAWSTDAYRQRERAVIEHIGRQYFFSRLEPDRKLVAPQFRKELGSLPT